MDIAEVNADADPGAQVERIRAQKRAYRTKKVLTNAAICAELCLISMIGQIVQHCTEWFGSVSFSWW